MTAPSEKRTLEVKTELVNNALKGSHVAQHEVIKIIGKVHHNELRLVLLSKLNTLNDQQSVNDILQDVYVKLLNRTGHWRDKNGALKALYPNRVSFQQELYKMLRTTLADHFRVPQKEGGPKRVKNNKGNDEVIHDENKGAIHVSLDLAPEIAAESKDPRESPEHLFGRVEEQLRVYYSSLHVEIFWHMQRGVTEAKKLFTVLGARFPEETEQKVEKARTAIIDLMRELKSN